MGCWHGYLCGARYTLFAYGPADATAVQEPHHLLCLIDIHTGFIFLVPAHPGCPGKEAVKLVYCSSSSYWLIVSNFSQLRDNFSDYFYVRLRDHLLTFHPLMWSVVW